jgi:hypothetical protein
MDLADVGSARYCNVPVKDMLPVSTVTQSAAVYPCTLCAVRACAGRIGSCIRWYFVIMPDIAVMGTSHSECTA